MGRLFLCKGGRIPLDVTLLSNFCNGITIHVELCVIVDRTLKSRLELPMNHNIGIATDGRGEVSV